MQYTLVKMALVYLDTNVYCRPFDNQGQERIRVETEAFEEILSLVQEKEVILLSSDILIFEVKNVFDPPKRSKVEVYLELCRQHIDESEDIRQLATRIRDNCKIRGRDAIHIASAILGRAEYCLTCDDKVTVEDKKLCTEELSETSGKKILIMNPVDFVKRWKGVKK